MPPRHVIHCSSPQLSACWALCLLQVVHQLPVALWLWVSFPCMHRHVMLYGLSACCCRAPPAYCVSRWRGRVSHGCCRHNVPSACACLTLLFCNNWELQRSAGPSRYLILHLVHTGLLQCVGWLVLDMSFVTCTALTTSASLKSRQEVGVPVPVVLAGIAGVETAGWSPTPPLLPCQLQSRKDDSLS